MFLAVAFSEAISNSNSRAVEVCSAVVEQVVEAMLAFSEAISNSRAVEVHSRRLQLRVVQRRVYLRRLQLRLLQLCRMSWVVGRGIENGHRK